ncbi:MAG: 3'-5' exonuclease [Luteolibacter sp.]
MTHPIIPPSKIEIAELEPFEGLGMERIFLVTNAEEAEAAFDELKRAGDVGFDTESKPTFRKGEKSEGPHVFQFATAERAYIFQSHIRECQPVIVALLESEEIIKIGFDLRGDLGHIWTRFGVRPNGIVDLDRSFKKLGYRNPLGAKSAVAILFQKRLMKSKSVTTSNWASPKLSDGQLIYAANDAYAALMVFRVL